MGGQGKTTLAKKVFCCADVKKCFERRAWITVTRDFRPRHILEELVGCFMSISKKQMREMNTKQLTKEFKNYIQKKRFMLVVDDIWSKEAWDFINSILPKTVIGNRVLLTTRHRDLAGYASDGSLCHHLESLSQEESWNLFCKIVFSDAPCPPTLEKIGKEMVAKCKGLPLAVVELGRILKSKHRFISEWNKVHKSVNSQLTKDETALSKILDLSICSLPRNLKDCFLYCAAFPMDGLIPAKTLVQYWIAEGFIEEKGGLALEEVAECYLTHLVNKNMIQVAKWTHLSGIKKCRVHNLLLARAISVAKKEKFLRVLNNHDTSELLSREPDSTHRLAIHSSTSSWRDPRDIATSSTQREDSWDSSMDSLEAFFTPNLHSLIYHACSFFSVKLLHRSESLKVINLQGAEITTLPDSIGMLINLRYMGLKRTKLTELPLSIGKIHNLQALYIKGTKIGTLPRSFTHLHNLRHLSGQFYTSLPNISALTNLEKLSSIPAKAMLEDTLGNLRNLKKLVVHEVDHEHSHALSDVLRKLKKLRVLHLYTELPRESRTGTQNILDNVSLGDLPDLNDLLLSANLEHLPNIDITSSNISKLTLKHSELREDPFSTLEKLPNLKVLSLWSAFMGNEMICSDNGFPQLTKLKIDSFAYLKKFTLGKGSMPNLKRLFIGNCKSFCQLPELNRISTLEELKVSGMPTPFEEKLRGGNQEWPKICNIRAVLIL